MERGTIVEAISWGVGMIRADSNGDRVVFTARVFNEEWSDAYAGRPVEFERYASGTEAKNVIGR